MNTWFEQPKRRLYTWTSPDGKHRNQIDYSSVNTLVLAQTKEFLSSRCARPNKGTAEQRDSRTKGRSNKGTGANYPPPPRPR